MAEAIELPATVRDASGKGAARAIRRAAMVPGIIYGGKDDPVSISVELRLLQKEMENPAFATNNYDVSVDGRKIRVLPRAVQTDPVTDRPIHIDFMRISAKTVVTVDVPVVFINERQAPGITNGGMLNIVRHAIEANVPAGDIPDAIEVDLTGRNIGDSIHISAVTLPPTVQPTITDRDFTIATIVAPTVTKAADATEGDGSEDGEG